MPEQMTDTAVAVVQQKSYPMREMLTILKDTGPEFVELYARDIIDREVAVAKFDQNWRIARVFSESGLFTDMREVAQAMTKIQLGESWNMAAADAMQHVYFVKGRPAVQNEYLASKMRDAGLDWEIEWHREGTECVGCTLWPSKLQPDMSWKPIMERANGQPVPASVTFTKADAERAGLKSDTYKNYAEDMYFWRCIARLRRRYATNILCGVLTRDEAEAIPDSPRLTASPEVATRGNTASLGDRLRERAAGQVATVTSPAPEPDAQVFEVTVLPEIMPARPWTDRNSLNAVYRQQRARIGETKCQEIFQQHNVLLASLRPDDPRAALIYADMLAAPMLVADSHKL